jgi:hypothetical protein
LNAGGVRVPRRIPENPTRRRRRARHLRRQTFGTEEVQGELRLALFVAGGRGQSGRQEVGVLKEKSMYGRKYMGIDRTTFVISPDGKIAAIINDVKPEQHAAAVLAAMKGS